MIKALGTALLLAAQNLSAAEPLALSETTYTPDNAVLMLGVNWGRTWKFGRYENAQIEALTFRQSPLTSDNQVSLELKTPSKLAIEDKFVPYAFVVKPGEYVLTSFDVKVARSVSDVGHLKRAEESLVKDGKPIGGSLSTQVRRCTSAISGWTAERNPSFGGITWRIKRNLKAGSSSSERNTLL